MSTLIYLSKRALVSILLLVIASFIVFAGIRATVDPSARLRFSKDRQAFLRERVRLHLDEPMLKQYTRWSSNLFSSKSDFPYVDINLGKSDIGSREEVTTKLARGMSNTFELVLWGIIVAGIIGISFGVISAINRNNLLDFTLSGFSYLGMALPTFFFGYVLIDFFTNNSPGYLPEWLSNIDKFWHRFTIWVLLLAILCGFIYWVIRLLNNNGRIKKYDLTNILKITVPLLIIGSLGIYLFIEWLVSRYSGINKPLLIINADVAGHFGRNVDGTFTFESFKAYCKGLAMPIMVLSIQLIATWSRYQRSSMVEALQSDYNRTALAKGMSKTRVYMRHAFRNAQLPMVTIIALDLGALMGGLIVTEKIFSLKGMGDVFTSSLRDGDATTLTGFTMLVAVFIIGANWLADVVYTIVDPRIRT